MLTCGPNRTCSEGNTRSLSSGGHRFTKTKKYKKPCTEEPTSKAHQPPHGDRGHTGVSYITSKQCTEATLQPRSSRRSSRSARATFHPHRRLSADERARSFSLLHSATALRPATYRRHCRGAGAAGSPPPPPGWPKAVESAALEAAGSSTQGRGGALGGPVSVRACLFFLACFLAFFHILWHIFCPSVFLSCVLAPPWECRAAQSHRARTEYAPSTRYGGAGGELGAC